MCSVNLIVYRTEMKAKLSFYFDHHFKSQIETLVSYSRSTNVNVNSSFPKSNFEGNLLLCVWQDILTMSRAEYWLLDFATYITKKIINPFVCVEVRILVEKLNVNEGHIFPRPLLQTCWMFKHLVTCKQKFSISHYFYWN